MGNFYVNFTVRSSTQKEIAKALKDAGRSAYVGPTLEGLTVFYDEASDQQDEAEIRSLGEQVSKQVDAPVLAVLNHDDDLLYYWLFEAGDCVDEYNSCPGYFGDGEDTPSGGDAAKLCAAFGVPKKAKQVDTILQNTEYAFALDRHQELVELLGLPSAYAFLGYRYIAAGELGDGMSKSDLVKVG